MDDVRRHLQKAAEAHRPDRDAIWARVQQGMTDSTDAERARSYRRRRQASWLKVTLAGAAGVGVLGLGGLAVAAGVQQRSPDRPTPSIGSPTSRAADADPTPRSSTSKPVQVPGTSAPRHSATPTPSPTPTPTPTADGPISAHGVVDAHSTIYWEQNTLAVDVSQPLSSFIVEVRIALTPGVQNTGTWLSAPPDDYTVTVTPADGYLVYRWTLKPGRTVPAAQQRFGAQFSHGACERDASKDTFIVEATAAGGHTASVHGGFAAAD